MDGTILSSFFDLMHHFWTLLAAENHMLIWRRSSHRVTQSGVHYDNAMEHLKSLRLPESIKESEANAMPSDPVCASIKLTMLSHVSWLFLMTMKVQ